MDKKENQEVEMDKEENQKVEMDKEKNQEVEMDKEENQKVEMDKEENQDVEMEDLDLLCYESFASIDRAVILEDLEDITKKIETAAYSQDDRRIVRAIRRTMHLRKELNSSDLLTFLDLTLLPGSETQSRLVAYVKEETICSCATSVSQAPAKNSLPEIEIYCYLLVLIFLIDQNRYYEAQDCASAGIARLKSLNSRIIDVHVLASRLYFYYSLSYELTGDLAEIRGGDLAEIRGNLLALLQTATLRHDELGQETLLNLLLRNYLQYNLYDQAEKLRSKSPRSAAHSNQQDCRYLFYIGKISTIRLEYTDAKMFLLEADRRAPASALGFRVQCNKWAVIVRLLLGEIPERAVFMKKGMEKALRPYFELTNAIRLGDLELFKSVAEKFAIDFISDKTNNLIVRLRHIVIRTGLISISMAYSRISLADVARKLRLDSIADIESIVSKAIRDGAIDASLDHANGWMISKENMDVYSTNEPQKVFNSRITHCFKMHNEASRALRFP